jgi:hypothetical protein
MVNVSQKTGTSLSKVWKICVLNGSALGFSGDFGFSGIIESKFWKSTKK